MTDDRDELVYICKPCAHAGTLVELHARYPEPGRTDWVCPNCLNIGATHYEGGQVDLSEYL